jgi:ApaG protein
MSSGESTSGHVPSGLFVTLDDLKYAYHPVQAMPDRPHMFTYHLTIHNQSQSTVAILARKWILRYQDGEVDVIEGDKVVGRTPELAPGQSFSYASFHLVAMNADVEGAFHGVDDAGHQIRATIPPFQLEIPDSQACN